MRKTEIYTLGSPYREDLKITGYAFGQEQTSACIEAAGKIAKNKGILVIPSINHHAMNIGKRFWPVDNTDINRMFPGYDLGETTQRIAAGVFEKVKDYDYGIQFASFYMPGDFIPHVRRTPAWPGFSAFPM